MPNMNNLILYQKVYDLILYSFPIISRFPKHQKHVLAQQIQNSMLNLSSLITQANVFGVKNKLQKIQMIDVEFEKLKLLIRLAHDLGFLSHDRYKIFSEKFVEIGKILGGWMKSYST